MAATRECDFCGEEVLAVAKKCKHCGEFLDEEARRSSTSATGRSYRKESDRLSMVGRILLGVFIGMVAGVIGGATFGLVVGAIALTAMIAFGLRARA